MYKRGLIISVAGGDLTSLNSPFHIMCSSVKSSVSALSRLKTLPSIPITFYTVLAHMKATLQNARE